MRIFHSAGEYEAKVNFVDGANTLVGYSTSQHCCESWGYRIADRPATSVTDGTDHYCNVTLEPYFFVPDAEPVRSTVAEVDAGDSIAFRLTDPTGSEPDLWLTLFNCHNGYYSHGFTVDVGGKRALEGDL